VEQIHSVGDHLLSLTHDERAAVPTIHPGRVDVIGGGAIILRVLADHLAEHADITHLTVSEKDILDGIALSLVTP
jgi:exopolyphosphatase/guanosine-5'-triphosphate,3'-diphosphate pyrophosphatase